MNEHSVIEISILIIHEGLLKQINQNWQKIGLITLNVFDQKMYNRSISIKSHLTYK